MYDGLSWVGHYNSFLALNKSEGDEYDERREERRTIA
jgi:hypothetical protein